MQKKTRETVAEGIQLTEDIKKLNKRISRYQLYKDLINTKTNQEASFEEFEKWFNNLPPERQVEFNKILDEVEQEMSNMNMEELTAFINEKINPQIYKEKNTK